MPRHIVQVRFNIPQGFRNINNNNTDARYIFGRNQLYRIAFMRFTLIYARVFPEAIRRIIEFILLIAALFSFLSLIYIHVIFVHLPVTCLEKYQKEWEGAKILRVELLHKKGNSNYSLYDSYYKEHAMKLLEAGLKPCPRVQHLQNDLNNMSSQSSSEDQSYKEESLDIADLLKCKLNESNEEKSFLDRVAEEIHAAFNIQPIEELNVMEYSLEYGFLRLSPSMRRSLNISILFVALDPNEDTCFGGVFNKFLLDQFLGYDELMLSSVRHLAARHNYKGYVRNVAKEVEYVFVNDNGWLHSYIVAAIIMPVTTFSVSLLLRFAHQQMFMACTNMFEFFRFQGQRRYNGSPLFTVILALFGMMAIITFHFIGMMAIITSFFHNSTLTLNITFIIWLADFYDSICCRALISKRHWYRFFLLYHYVFYAYNHRFNGQHWQLNLLTSWLFILHSMVFFFHHYELPYYVQSFVQFRETHILRPPRSHPQVASTSSSTDQSTEPVVAHPDEEIISREISSSEDNVVPDSDDIIESLVDDNQQVLEESNPIHPESSDNSIQDIPSNEVCFKCRTDEPHTCDAACVQQSCFKKKTENSLEDDACIRNEEMSEASSSGSSLSRGTASDSFNNSSRSELSKEYQKEESNLDSEEMYSNTTSNGQNKTEISRCISNLKHRITQIADKVVLTEKPPESN